MKQATRAARLLLIGAASLLASLQSGCATMNNAEKGALVGGGAGAGVGALIGSTKGKAGPGALIGGAVGALGGALTGAAVDENKRHTEAAIAAANAPPPLSLEDVVRLTSTGSSDDVIIGQIYNTGSVYRLTADQIIYLQNNGVRENVIQAMQATARFRPVRRVYTETPVYVVPAPPPPPPPIGFGIAIRGGR